jgi:hypothetical protein
MSDTGAPLSGGEGMGQAREAFEAALDAETPSKSVKRESPKKESRLALDDLFPRRDMDRSEPEGGANDIPDVVKKRRAEAGYKDDDDQPTRKAKSPHTPTEVTDEDDADPPEPGDDELEPDPDEEDETPEPEPDEDDEPPEQGDLDLDQVVEVSIDGQPHEVSLKEAIRGYIRTETFHQRMGELATGAQALRQRSEEIDNSRQALVERAEALESYVAAFMPKEPDWDALYAQNPAEAARYERQWRSFNDKLNGLAQQRATTKQELADAQAASLTQFANTNRARLAADHSEWKNEKVWKRDHDSMRRTARAVGYTDQEIDQLYDARGVEILLKAAKYDRMMASKPKPVARPVAPSNRRNGATPQKRNGQTSFERAEKRLSRTGSVNDAAAVFERILDRER